MMHANDSESGDHSSDNSLAAPNTKNKGLVIPDDINELTISEAARFYVEQLGLVVIPQYPITSKNVKSRGKQPMINGFRRMTVADMTETYLTEKFPERTDRNLGAVLQGKLIVLDFDAKQDEGASANKWLEQHPDFQVYPRVNTKHGFHIFVVVEDLPANTKKLSHEVNEQLVIELITPPNTITLAPSLRVDGEPYAWEKTGNIPEIKWQDLLKRLGIEEKKQGRPKKPRHFSLKYNGDLNTLDLKALLKEKSMLGDCINADENKYAVRCPWEQEHSDQHKDIQSDTAVLCGEGRMPIFKCLHAHCEEHSIEQLLAWLESQDPGIIDKHCAERRAYGFGETEDEHNKPLITHAGEGRLVSQVAEELASIVAPKYQWFQRSGTTVEVVTNQKTNRLEFQGVTPISACGGVEQFTTPVVVRTDNHGTSKVAHSFSAGAIAPLLQAPQFNRKLPVIERILPVSLPILDDEGNLTRPHAGYNPGLRSYLQPDAPQIEEMTVEEAKQVLGDILGDFCFSSEQDATHAIARLLTPYTRGLMGWTARVPLWLFMANRPRTGKDCLAGVNSTIYTGDIQEDVPLEKGSDETRKRITAALMAGRGFMHLANCQGYINDAALIGAITARVIRARNLGSTAADADLELPNEMEFSISANVGFTYREDIEPRTRRITLAFYEEDPNKRVFRYPDLHGHVRNNRGRILGALDAFVAEWQRQGMPDGATPFTSFPEWSRVVGGIMQANGLGDPCLPHEAELKMGGDLKERAIRAIYKLGFAKWPNQWVTKAALYDALRESDDEDIDWLGSLVGEEEKKTKTKIGMALKGYEGRFLDGICLKIDLNGKGANQEIQFSKADGEKPAKIGTLGNFGTLIIPSAGEKIKPSSIIHNDINYSIEETAPEVSEVSEVSKSAYRLVTEPQDLADIAAAISEASSVALDCETYGPGKDGALNPLQGKIRLLQLAVPDHEPCIIDLDSLGQDLGPLKPALEAAEVIVHNARFDLGFLREHYGIMPAKVYCTLTASKLLTNGLKEKKNDLTTCLGRHLNVPAYPDESKSGWRGVLTPSQLAYAAADVEHLHALREALDEQIDQAELRRVLELEMELIPAVVDLEAAGLWLDPDELDRQIQQATQAAEQAGNALRELSGDLELNPASSKQIKAMLHEQGLDLPNTSKDTLARHAQHEAVANLLIFRKQSKLASMLQGLHQKLDGDGRLRASFNPLGTTTGRFSSSGPNLQNIPRGAPRAIVKPTEGKAFVRADYSQIELRIAAALAGEKQMLEAFRKGADPHRQTAAIVANKDPDDITSDERQEAKAVNFGFLYGMGADGFRAQAKTQYGVDLRLERAEELRAAFFKAYPAFKTWHDQAWCKVRAKVKEARTRTKRRRLIPAQAKAWGRFTDSVNTPVQGLGADGMKLALTRLHRELPAGAQIILTVHDDVLVECLEELAPNVAALVEQAMIEEMSELVPEVPIEVEAEILSEWE